MSQTAMKPMIAQRTKDRSGRPLNPPPPKRARPRRSQSSSGVTPEDPSDTRRGRRDGSPHGPPWPSSGGGSPPASPPPLGPHGPFVSVNSPRMRPPHPRRLLIAAKYRERARRKTVPTRDGL